MWEKILLKTGSVFPSCNFLNILMPLIWEIHFWKLPAFGKMRIAKMEKRGKERKKKEKDEVGRSKNNTMLLVCSSRRKPKPVSCGSKRESYRSNFEICWNSKPHFSRSNIKICLEAYLYTNSHCTFPRTCEQFVSEKCWRRYRL